MKRTQLRLYRRHVKRCRFKSRGQYYTGCSCPIWAVGEVAGVDYRRSLGLRDWNMAVRRVEEIEREPEKALIPVVNIESAVAAYLSDCEARHLAPSTVHRYRVTLAPFVEFCKAQRIAEVYSITVPLLTAYRASRKIMASTQGTELELMRAFCAFCMTQGWLDSNPAKALKPPAEDSAPTLPFSQDEVSALLGACDLIENHYRASAARARVRARALVLLLVYSGLRISDAGKLKRDSLTEDGRLFLRTMKTKAPLHVQLPPSVVDALNAMPRESDEYFFWSGRGKLSSLLGSLRRTVVCLGSLANVDAHPHRFRDTFAVRLLEKGVSIRTVQLLLGHTNVKTTEKHYAPFMRSHQRILDEAVALLDFQESSSVRDTAVSPTQEL